MTEGLWWDAPPEEGPEYTVVGIIEDGAELNRMVWDLRRLGVDHENLTVILKA